MITLLHVLELVVVSLAAARITRLVTIDAITENLRVRLVAKANRDWVEKLITCPWCIGFWITAAMEIVTLTWHNKWWAGAMLVLAATQIVGLLARADKGYQ